MCCYRACCSPAYKHHRQHRPLLHRHRRRWSRNRHLLPSRNRRRATVESASRRQVAKDCWNYLKMIALRHRCSISVIRQRASGPERSMWARSPIPKLRPMSTAKPALTDRLSRRSGELICRPSDEDRTRRSVWAVHGFRPDVAPHDAGKWRSSRLQGGEPQPAIQRRAEPQFGRPQRVKHQLAEPQSARPQPTGIPGPEQRQPAEPQLGRPPPARDPRAESQLGRPQRVKQQRGEPQLGRQQRAEHPRRGSAER